MLPCADRLQVGEVVSTIPSKSGCGRDDTCSLRLALPYTTQARLTVLDTVLACMCAAIGFNVETVSYKNIKFQVWDLGGQTSIRPYWRCYYPNTQAIIYVIDSTDSDRLGISRDEFKAILEEEELKESLILVYANKQVRCSGVIHTCCCVCVCAGGGAAPKAFRRGSRGT